MKNKIDKPLFKPSFQKTKINKIRKRRYNNRHHCNLKNYSGTI